MTKPDLRVLPGPYALHTFFTSTALSITPNLFACIGLSDSTGFPGQKLLDLGSYRRTYGSPTMDVMYFYVFSNNNVPTPSHPNYKCTRPPLSNSEKQLRCSMKSRITGTQGVSIVLPATPLYFKAVGQRLADLGNQVLHFIATVL